MLTGMNIILHAIEYQKTHKIIKPNIRPQSLDLLIHQGINPNKQRKGKSGEILKRGGKGKR